MRNWIDSAQNRDFWTALVNVALNLPISGNISLYSATLCSHECPPMPITGSTNRETFYFNSPIDGSDIKLSCYLNLNAVVVCMQGVQGYIPSFSEILIHYKIM